MSALEIHSSSRHVVAALMPLVAHSDSTIRLPKESAIDI
jgi:hypothetical protein